MLKVGDIVTGNDCFNITNSLAKCVILEILPSNMCEVKILAYLPKISPTKKAWPYHIGDRFNLPVGKLTLYAQHIVSRRS